MITTLLHLLRLFPFLCGGHRQLALENLALRHQLAVYKRTAGRPTLHRSDRLFWAWLSKVWTGRKSSLLPVWRRGSNRGIVTPSRGGARWMTALAHFALGFTP